MEPREVTQHCRATCHAVKLTSTVMSPAMRLRRICAEEEVCLKLTRWHFDMGACLKKHLPIIFVASMYTIS